MRGTSFFSFIFSFLFFSSFLSFFFSFSKFIREDLPEATSARVRLVISPSGLRLEKFEKRRESFFVLGKFNGSFLTFLSSC